MKLSVSCPHCKATLAGKPQHVGKKLGCPRCGTKFVVRDPAVQSPTEMDVVAPAGAPVDRTSALERAMKWRVTPGEEAQATETNSPLARWKPWLFVGGGTAATLVVAASIYVWTHPVTQPPPPPATVEVPATPDTTQVRSAPPKPTSDELEDQLKSPNGIDLGGNVTWEHLTPGGADAAFVAAPVEGDGFTRWPIKLENVLSDLRVRELTKPPGPMRERFFMRCLWSNDESLAFLISSDQHLIVVDVGSRTIKSVIETRGLMDIARCKGGWVILQDSGRVDKKSVGPNLYEPIRLFNLIHLDEDLQIRQCLRDSNARRICASPNSSWVYTNQSAIDLDKGTIDKIVVRSDSGGPHKPSDWVDLVFSLDGEHLYCLYEFGVHRLRTSGATLTWVEKMEESWINSPEGMFLFRRAPLDPSRLGTGKPPPQFAADGRRTFLQHNHTSEGEYRYDLNVVEDSRKLTIPILRIGSNDSGPHAATVYLSPSGRTTFVYGYGPRPESIFWLEIDD